MNLATLSFGIIPDLNCRLCLSIYCFLWVRELLAGLHDVAIMPLRPSFSTKFLENCCRDECLRTNTCLKTMVEGKEGHAPCMIFPSHFLFGTIAT